MELTGKLLNELQNRLKVGNRRGVHLNAIPGRSRYKFDLNRLSYLDKELPQQFINALLTELPLRFKISWKDNVPDLNSLFKEDQAQIVKITKSFENLINQTEAIESEKGINTFGFGFPLLVRRDQADKKLTVAPILVWSLRIKRTKEFNTWVVQRNEDDPIYINEVLINHLQSDSNVVIEQVSSELLDDGLIDHDELIEICKGFVTAINTNIPEDIENLLTQKLSNVGAIPDKKHFEKLPLSHNNSLIEFGGLFSIFEVQKQNIINDYDKLMDLEGMVLNLDDLTEHSFQPISSIETDPSQQSVLHSLQKTRNILIQGPPGTGKSQSLTAVLINALENHKRTVVVCEKRTALEVLHQALSEKELQDHIVLIKDIVKDRRSVVNSVRDRLDNSSYKRYHYNYSKETLNNIINRTKFLIDSINHKHQELDKKLIEDRNWTDTVGRLLGELRYNNEDTELHFDISGLKYNSNELTELLRLAKEGQRLYADYNPHKQYSFLDSTKLVGDNPYFLEDKIKEAFKRYSNDLLGPESIIKSIRKRNESNPDLFDLDKTTNLWYKFSAFFSEQKKQTLKDQENLLSACIELAKKIEQDGWIQSKINKATSEQIIIEVEKILKSEKVFFDHANDLFLNEFRWFQYYNDLTSYQKSIIDSLKGKEDWKKVLLVHYLNSLLRKSASSRLPISDNEHKELAETLTEVGKEQLRYIKEYWYSKQLDAARDFNTLNDNLNIENLYNKRSSRNHKRLSLRQIVQYDPELFTTLFPIILTTPDVCSNLFKGMNEFFDIVLFDEASQLRLEDNLPALLKGKQIIIAGDEHQMPPSNYFSKIFDGTIDDEDEIEEDEEVTIDRDNLLLSCESLLEFAGELTFEKRYLDFHYRSRHPYLIDFSNHAFYNRRLKPLPNNFDYTPIKYIQVGGTFSDHTNEVEAEAVLSIIENNINRLPNGEYPSVGVATFNISQRNLIKSKILERRKFEQYDEFNQKILELEEAGLFIKNLENIQGDERDVIILSTTYGIKEDGRFVQRFGPINHKKGYKLLNVIVTRAKYKIFVCSSIPEQVFLNFKEHLETEGSNNRKAVFYAYLAYAKAVSESDDELKNNVFSALAKNTSDGEQLDNLNEELESPFEEEVYQVLRENFDEEKLIPQMQFAGYRIDIVYDPKIPGVPKVAIECDGALYHSSEEAYLYDHHRQKILEGYGFVFHRIWSTNWWRNQKREERKLIEFINDIETRGPRSVQDYDRIPESFNDDLTKVRVVPKLNNERDKLEKTIIESSFKSENSQAKLFENIVEPVSRVRVKYLNNGKSIIVQLVSRVPKENGNSDGVQKINNRSPLARSIIGKPVGETVKVGDLDNYVKIVEIIK